MGMGSLLFFLWASQLWLHSELIYLYVQTFDNCLSLLRVVFHWLQQSPLITGTPTGGIASSLWPGTPPFVSNCKWIQMFFKEWIMKGEGTNGIFIHGSTCFQFLLLTLDQYWRNIHIVLPYQYKYKYVFLRQTLHIRHCQASLSIHFTISTFSLGLISQCAIFYSTLVCVFKAEIVKTFHNVCRYVVPNKCHKLYDSKI
jgi:hypothetical protein